RQPAPPRPQPPRNFPNARKPLKLSQTALIPAVKGIASNRPGASHRNPQIISENVTTSGFRWTREPTIFGYNTFNATRWSMATVTTTSTYTGTAFSGMAANRGGIHGQWQADIRHQAHHPAQRTHQQGIRHAHRPK